MLDLVFRHAGIGATADASVITDGAADTEDGGDQKGRPMLLDGGVDGLVLFWETLSCDYLTEYERGVPRLNSAL